MASDPRCLTALPVFNEVTHLDAVLDEVLRHACTVLVIDDGSTDGSRELLEQRVAERGDVIVVHHPQNRGYGAALRTAFDYALEHDYEVLVTIDCDGQHEPQLISTLAAAVFADDAHAAGETRDCQQRIDIVSGSRYLETDAVSVGDAPADRRRINQTITRELNEQLGLELTDAFCGFKAYRVASLARLDLTEPGYAMPLELWVQAARRGFRVVEHAVPLIYLDEERSFGGVLDESETRLAHYREVIARAMAADAARCDARSLSSACSLGAEAC